MPQLKQLSCNVNWGDTGAPFQEYGTVYGDGIVETFIVVPQNPQSFTIHLTSHGYIYEGLSMAVFVDGNYQCNRNRVNLVPAKKDVPRNRTEVDFLLRQKEKPHGEGIYMGRQWRFDNHNIIPETPIGIKASHFDLLGTIEVLVLRCRAQSPDETNMSVSSSGEDSDILDTRSEYKDTSNQNVTSNDQPSDQVVRAPTQETANQGGEVEDAFAGGLFGLFTDGASDCALPLGLDGDAPGSGTGRWVWHQKRAPYNNYSYPYHHSAQASYPQTFGDSEDTGVNTGAASSVPHHNNPHYRARYHPRPEKRVHFDYGPYTPPPSTPLTHASPQYTPQSYDRQRPLYHENGNILLPQGPPYQPQQSQTPVSESSNTNSVLPVSERPRREVGDEQYSDEPVQQNLNTDSNTGPYSCPGVPMPVNSTGSFPPDNTQQPRPQPLPNQACPYSFPPNVPPQWTQSISGAYAPYHPSMWNLDHTQHLPFIAGYQPQFLPPYIPTFSSTPGAFMGQGYTYPYPNSNLDNAIQYPTTGQNVGDTNDKTREAGINHDQANGANSAESQNQANDSNANNDAPGGSTDQKDQNQDQSWEISGQTEGAKTTSWDEPQKDDELKENKSANSNNSNDNDTGWGESEDKSGGNNNTNINNGIDNSWEKTNNDNRGDDWGNSNNNNSQTNGIAGLAEVIPNADADGGLITRPLYGPYGAYYALNPPQLHEPSPDAEEEPRYDVPRAIAESMGSSRQVQPGAGYLYCKKRCCPEYIDPLDQPYARFVFKYRTKGYRVLSIQIEAEPSGNHEIQEFQNMDKQALIDLLIRAKSALGGRVPSPPPNPATTTAVNGSATPVPVDPPDCSFLHYSLPPLRSFSGNYGVQDNNAPPKVENGWGGSNTGANNENKDPAAKNDNSWENSNNNNTSDNNNQQWNSNNNTGASGGWDGQQEKGRDQTGNGTSQQQSNAEETKTQYQPLPQLQVPSQNQQPSTISQAPAGGSAFGLMPGFAGRPPDSHRPLTPPQSQTPGNWPTSDPNQFGQAENTGSNWNSGGAAAAGNDGW